MRNIQDLKKDEQDVLSLKRRSKVVFAFLFILILASIFKIFQLTVLEKANYSVESEKNRIIEVPIFPSRGLITLEDGTIIAENIVTHGIFIQGSLLESSKDQLDILYRDVLDLERKFPVPQTTKQNQKIWLARDLSSKELAKYEFHKNSLSNIKLGTSLRRYLPHKNLFSHVIGHLGPITSDERLSLSKTDYPVDAFIGKVGIEKVYEKSLKGSVGKSIIEVDVYGNKIREIERIDPERPQNITLKSQF